MSKVYQGVLVPPQPLRRGSYQCAWCGVEIDSHLAGNAPKSCRACLGYDRFAASKAAGA